MHLERLQKAGAGCYARSTFPDFTSCPHLYPPKEGCCVSSYKRGNGGQEPSHLTLDIHAAPSVPTLLRVLGSTGGDGDVPMPAIKCPSDAGWPDPRSPN